MNDPRPHSTAPVQLPRALIDRIAPPFVRFLHIEAAGGAQRNGRLIAQRLLVVGEITGHAVADSNVVRSVRESVRLRNDVPSVVPNRDCPPA